MKKKIIGIIFIASVLLLAALFFQKKDTGIPSDTQKNLESGVVIDPKKEIPAVTVLGKNLRIPWDIAFLPDNNLLVTERGGKILKMNASGSIREISLATIRKNGEGGLLGIVLDPNFTENQFLYLYLTAPGEDGNTENRVERYRFDGETLAQKTIIISGIPGAIYHDGGRMEFGPDGFLYITTGDATDAAIAQDKNSLGGKILRIRSDGSIPSDNPFGTAVYSFGHRNPQGIAWDNDGRLWETEHGRSGVLSGLDEVNLIQKGGNYGWPDIEGNEKKSGMIPPVLHSGSDATWAPASAAYLNGSLFFGGLRGEALYEAVLEGEKITQLKIHFQGQFGRIRTVRVGPDGMLYLTTSNHDGRGIPKEGDDKIVRINPLLLD